MGIENLVYTGQIPNMNIDPSWATPNFVPSYMPGFSPNGTNLAPMKYDAFYPKTGFVERNEFKDFISKHKWLSAGIGLIAAGIIFGIIKRKPKEVIKNARKIFIPKSRGKITNKNVGITNFKEKLKLIFTPKSRGKRKYPTTKQEIIDISPKKELKTPNQNRLEDFNIPTPTKKPPEPKIITHTPNATTTPEKSIHWDDANKMIADKAKADKAARLRNKQKDVNNQNKLRERHHTRLQNTQLKSMQNKMQK